MLYLFCVQVINFWFAYVYIKTYIFNARAPRSAHAPGVFHGVGSQLQQVPRVIWAIVPGFFDNMITSDDTWCFHYYPEVKRQNAKWQRTIQSPKKTRMSMYKGKSMFTVLFDAKVHYEFVAECQIFSCTINEEVMKRLKWSIEWGQALSPIGSFVIVMQ